MKKTLVKIGVFVAVFILTSFIANQFMNKNRDNMTTEMEVPSLPLLTMELDDIPYNQLYGYTEPVEIAFQRDSITILGENREADFTVQTYGANVSGIRVEVRSEDGSRLIENSEVTDYHRSGMSIEGKISLKDLLERDTVYSLVIVLEIDGDREVRYYTRGIWSDSLYAKEKLQYVIDFHNKLYDPIAAKDLTKYLETNYSLEDNRSFHKVNIHSSFRQITWDQLGVKEVSEPKVRLAEISEQMATIMVDYVISSTQDEKDTYYLAQEYFYIRYTKDRIYLLDYERTTTQIPVGSFMCTNDKIALGITGTDIHKKESPDGKTVTFVSANRLFSYNVSDNKLALLFGFYEEKVQDIRTLNNHHNIRILNVNDTGDVQFAVYGYMNRGRHEGQMGIAIYAYQSALNTLEEMLFIPYDRSYALLEAEMDQLISLNDTNDIYLLLNNRVVRISLSERIFEVILEYAQESGFMVSDNHEIAMWQYPREGKDVPGVKVYNFATNTSYDLEIGEGEVVVPLGFMENDIICGITWKQDIVTEKSGGKFYPMYKVTITDAQGELLKEYQQEGVYVTGMETVDNHITLHRVEKKADGSYLKIADDHIMNNNEDGQGKNPITVAVIDRYKEYVQIQVSKKIDEDTLAITTPKEVAMEGERNLTLPERGEDGRYYVYRGDSVEGIFRQPAAAVRLAHGSAGTVLDGRGRVIWEKGNLVSKNQIMAIKEPEKTAPGKSLAKCLDTISEFEGMVRPSEIRLSQGKTALQILTENLADDTVLDLSGTNLDAMLYYLNMDIPVLVLLNNGEAVVLTGFNEQQVVIMEPSTGGLYKITKTEAAKWFEENGNTFITYMRH